MVLPLADIAELVSSEYFLSGALIIGGMLIGAYGQAGKFPVITAFGIFCVMAGAVEQFTTVAGKSEGVSDRILTTVGFLGAVLIGVFALGLGLRRRDSALGGLSLASAFWSSRGVRPRCSWRFSSSTARSAASTELGGLGLGPPRNQRIETSGRLAGLGGPGERPFIERERRSILGGAGRRPRGGRGGRLPDRGGPSRGHRDPCRRGSADRRRGARCRRARRRRRGPGAQGDRRARDRRGASGSGGALGRGGDGRGGLGDQDRPSASTTRSSAGSRSSCGRAPSESCGSWRGGCEPRQLTGSTPSWLPVERSSRARSRA